jgi:colicin import membrane protein
VQAIGLIFSVALHGALLFWAALEILGTSELPEPAAPTIEAEIISISEFTKLKQGDPESKKLVAKATPEVEPQVSKKEAPRPKPPKPTPPPAAEEPPPKLPEPEPPKAETPPLQPDKIAEKIDSSSPPVPAPPDVDAAARKKKAEIQRKYKEKLRKEAERKRKLAEKKRREAKKKKKAEKKRKEQDFTKRMAALLDKTPEERGSRRSGSSLESEYLGPLAGEREGSGDELTAREADLLKGQISAQLRDCWRLPGGGGGIEVVQVRLSWRLKRDGALEGEPQVIGTSRDPTFRVAAEAAIRAVKCAAPFQLPSENYEAWRYIKEWNFDPRQML